MPTFDESRPTHESSLRAQITRLESQRDALLAARKAAEIDLIAEAVVTGYPEIAARKFPHIKRITDAIALAEGGAK